MWKKQYPRLIVIPCTTQASPEEEEDLPAISARDPEGDSDDKYQWRPAYHQYDQECVDYRKVSIIRRGNQGYTDGCISKKFVRPSTICDRILYQALPRKALSRASCIRHSLRAMLREKGGSGGVVWDPTILGTCDFEIMPGAGFTRRLCFVRY